jgi:hypothetical protein
MSELPQSVVSESKLIVREWGVYIEFLLSSHAYLQLMLCAWVSDDLPVVDSLHERPVPYHCPKVVIGFAEKQVSAISAELYFSRGVLWVPCEFIGVLLPPIDMMKTHNWMLMCRILDYLIVHELYQWLIHHLFLLFTISLDVFKRIRATPFIISHIMGYFITSKRSVNSFLT